jgi:hypothetical protein
MKQLGSVAIVLVVVGALYAAGSTRPSYTAVLAGSTEVPPVRTKAKGEATFIVNKAKTSIDYKITVSGLQDVTQAHIHLGEPGKNGQHVVDLYHKPDVASPKSNVIAQGRITAADLTGPMKGKMIPDLIKAMDSGDTYVNVHTKAHPDGEIRGQIQVQRGKGEAECG